MSSDGVFSGLRVLDLTQGFAGALSTMVLGDNGAAVLRIVPDDPACADPLDGSAGALQWHRSKRTVSVADVGREVALVDELLDEADIAIESAHSPVCDALGISLHDAIARRPRLIACRIDAFSEHPTLRDLPLHEGAVAAAAGRMTDFGRSFRFDRPVYVAPPLAGFGAANAALQGICSALLRLTGDHHDDDHDREHGQFVSTSMARGLTIFDFFGPAGFATRPAAAPGGPGPHPALGYIPARTKDGRWLQWANYAPHLLWNELEVLGLGALRDDPAYKAMPALPPAQAHDVWARVLEATATRTADEWIDVLRSTGAAGGDVFRDTVEGMDHPQARHNGNVIRVDAGGTGAGVNEQIGPVADMPRTPGRLGPHDWNAETAANASDSDAERRPAPAPTSGDAPLAGIVVLEAATMIATPVGSALLADLGARVVKIEPIGGEPGRSLPFTKTLQGKESIAVDIKHPDGREIVQRLAARADIFLHNYRPGVPEKLGIDAASLREVNPRLVYLYAGAYGKDGPYAKMPAYHPIAGAICGNAVRQAGHGALGGDDADDLATRKAQSLRLSVANEGHPDPVTGALVATVLLMGLVGRRRFGAAQEMTTTMLCASAYLMSADWIRYDGRPPIDEVDADLLGTNALNRLYPTRDGWVFLACPTDAEWGRLLAALDVPALRADARFADRAARRAHDQDLAIALAAVFGGRDADSVEAACVASRVACVRADRGGFAEFQQAEIASGRFELARRMDGDGDWRAAPVVSIDGAGPVGSPSQAGEHTVAILDELGYSTERIDELIAEGVVGTPAS
jgi:crotonobetainyl-CoA:carnitine CoA-transferase CaiB-like acyl-CoA transferase